MLKHTDFLKFINLNNYSIFLFKDNIQSSFGENENTSDNFKIINELNINCEDSNSLNEDISGKF